MTAADVLFGTGGGSGGGDGVVMVVLAVFGAFVFGGSLIWRMYFGGIHER